MTEIRNLTRNGETFYPQTHVEGVLDPDGNYIGYYVDNPEWIRVITDSDDKILVGIKSDGSIEWSIGVPQPIKDYIQENIITVLQDKVDKEEGKGLINSDFASSQSAIENPEFLEVTVDSEDKVLEGRKTDGTKIELIGIETPKISIDGNILSNFNDPESRLEIKTDSNQKIISLRKSDGTLVENAGIETNHLELTKQGMTDFQQALKDSGFIPGGGGDWSDRETIELPEPKYYAILNIDVDYIPTTSGDARDSVVQYYDGLGNYFKLNAKIEIQGQTSRIFSRNGCKSNYTLDLSKDIKFGSWVPQDSFHLKGCYKDATRCMLPTSYKLAYKIVNYLDAKPNRLRLHDSDITEFDSTGDRFSDYPDDARCLPDGFPIEVYVNNEYNGLYSLQLKKHRKNYSMDKKDYTSFFLDADDSMDVFWNCDIRWDRFEIKGPKDLILMDGSEYGERGELISSKITTYDTTNWEKTGNCTVVIPSSNIWSSDINYVVGNKVWFPYLHSEDVWIEYEALSNNVNAPCAIQISNPNYDSSNKKHKNSAKTKALIEQMPVKFQEIKRMINLNTQESLAEAKSLFSDYFDVNACMVVFLFNGIMNNSDSVNKNTLWAVYDGNKIAPMLWDLDSVYGTGWIGNKVGLPPNAGVISYYRTFNWPLSQLWKLYRDDVVTAYHNLRRDGIVSMSTWREVIYSWVNRVGKECYERDIEKWPETPSYRKNYTNTEYWKQNIYDGNIQASLWDSNTSYEVDEYVYLDAGEGQRIIYQAIQNVPAGICPVTEYYDKFPYVGGYYESPKRMEKWISHQLDLCDEVFEYTDNL
jgi:hypothetical protein